MRNCLHPRQPVRQHDHRRYNGCVTARRNGSRLLMHLPIACGLALLSAAHAHAEITFLNTWGANGGDGTSGNGDGEFFFAEGVAVAGRARSTSRMEVTIASSGFSIPRPGSRAQTRLSTTLSDRPVSWLEVERS